MVDRAAYEAAVVEMIRRSLDRRLPDDVTDLIVAAASGLPADLMWLDAEAAATYAARTVPAFARSANPYTLWRSWRRKGWTPPEDRIVVWHGVPRPLWRPKTLAEWTERKENDR